MPLKLQRQICTPKPATGCIKNKRRLAVKQYRSDYRTPGSQSQTPAGSMRFNGRVSERI